MKITPSFVDVTIGPSSARLDHQPPFLQSANSFHDSVVTFTPQNAFEHSFAFASSSSSSSSSSTFLAVSDASTTQTFEPVLPDMTALLGMGSIVVLSVIAASVWANEVVPVSRTKLAISKNKGEVKEYLDGLKVASPSVGTVGEELASSEDGMVLISSVEGEDATTPQQSAATVGGGDDRGFERWLFADWLNDNKSAKKPAAVPFLKKAKWNSGDNPVLVTSGLLLVCILFASITERAGMMGIR